MTQPIHIMLDLKTWGTLPGDEPRSIGACVFSPVAGLVAGDGWEQPEQFYVALDNPGVTPDEALSANAFGDVLQDASYPHYDATTNTYRKYVMRRDPETVAWWSDQPAEAQAAFAAPVDLHDGLYQFGAWLDGLTGRDGGVMPDFSVFRIWSHGANFDPGIISAAFRAVGLPDIIHYRTPRDTRTIFEAAGMDPATCLNDFQHPGAIHHHALHDAIVQARAVCEAYRRLGLQDPLMRQATPVTVLEDLRNGIKPINLNDNVRVKLNDHGRAICAAAELLLQETEEGFSVWQLWDLMHTFGPHLFNGCQLPFDSTTILT